MRAKCVYFKLFYELSLSNMRYMIAKAHVTSIRSKMQSKQNLLKNQCAVAIFNHEIKICALLQIYFWYEVGKTQHQQNKIGDCSTCNLFFFMCSVSFCATCMQVINNMNRTNVCICVGWVNETN